MQTTAFYCRGFKFGQNTAKIERFEWLWHNVPPAADSCRNSRQGSRAPCIGAHKNPECVGAQMHSDCRAMQPPTPQDQGCCPAGTAWQ